MGRLIVSDYREASVDQYVTELNIQHFKRLIAKTHDETDRQTLHHLLAAEEANLAAILASPADRR